MSYFSNRSSDHILNHGKINKQSTDNFYNSDRYTFDEKGDKYFTDGGKTANYKAKFQIKIWP